MSECPFQSRLSAFHDHELDAELAAKIESHLSDCPQCAQTLHGIRMVTRLLGETKTGQMSQIGVARLHATATAAAKRPDVFPLVRALLATAASVLIIASAFLYETPARPIPGAPAIVVRPDKQKEADWEKLARGEKLRSPLEVRNDTDVASDFSKWMVNGLKGESGS